MFSVKTTRRASLRDHNTSLLRICSRRRKKIAPSGKNIDQRKILTARKELEIRKKFQCSLLHIYLHCEQLREASVHWADHSVPFLAHYEVEVLRSLLEEDKARIFSAMYSPKCSTWDLVDCLFSQFCSHLFGHMRGSVEKNGNRCSVLSLCPGSGIYASMHCSFKVVAR